MKLKTTKKNLIVLTGLLLIGGSAVQGLTATQQLCPTTDTEVLIIDGFA